MCCHSISRATWSHWFGLCQASLVSRLLMLWRKTKKQLTGMVFTQGDLFHAVSSFQHKGVFMMVVVLLLAESIVTVSLLLRSGDVEQNPGPGLYPGELAT